MVRFGCFKHTRRDEDNCGRFCFFFYSSDKKTQDMNRPLRKHRTNRMILFGKFCLDLTWIAVITFYKMVCQFYLMSYKTERGDGFNLK